MIKIYKLDINYCNSNGDCVFNLACCNNMRELCDLLVECYDIDYNKRNIHGKTALFHAYVADQVDAFCKLIDYNDIDCSCFTDDYNNLSDYTSEEVDCDVLLLLVDCPRFKYNTIDKNDQTFLMWACENDFTYIVRKLLKKEDINYEYVNKQGMSAMKIAEENKLKVVIKDIQLLRRTKL